MPVSTKIVFLRLPVKQFAKINPIDGILIALLLQKKGRNFQLFCNEADKQPNLSFNLTSHLSCGSVLV